MLRRGYIRGYVVGVDDLTMLSHNELIAFFGGRRLHQYLRSATPCFQWELRFLVLRRPPGGCAARPIARFEANLYRPVLATNSTSPPDIDRSCLTDYRIWPFVRPIRTELLRSRQAEATVGDSIVN